MKKIVYGIIINLFLTFVSFFYVSFLLSIKFNFYNFFIIFISRQFVSFFFYNDYKASWSKASIITTFIKAVSNIISFIFYFSFFRIFEINIPFSLLIFEFITFILLIFVMIYSYRFLKVESIFLSKEKIIIYGAGRAGINIQSELINSKILYFIDDDPKLRYRSIDGIKIISQKKLIKSNLDLSDIVLIIALPSVKNQKRIKIYERFKSKVKEVKILPSVNKILDNKPYYKQLKKISILDLLARDPKDLDNDKISNFIKNKIILITGSAGTIGSELIKIAVQNKSKKIIAIDHNEFGQYKLLEKKYDNIIVLVGSVLNINFINNVFNKFKPDIVLHAAAYKHVHLSEYSVESTIVNNVLGTKYIVDTSIKFNVQKFILISTDKAVNPTNIMGASKSVCELYCQNIISNKTDIISVRFGNVLGSSGSVIPKFQNQIDRNKNITVTHKDVTRFFMLVNEACNLVYQSASIGNNGEILILDMGKPIKISDLAHKMIELSGKNYLKVEYVGLRKGEKLYEELMFSENDKKTVYDSITVAKKRDIDFYELEKNIELLSNPKSNKVEVLKNILPDFNHLRDN